MSRVVAYKRFSPEQRRVQIYNCVSRLSATKGYATITDIAKRLDMTPSTHLKNLALAMVVNDKIDLVVRENLRGIKVYQFYLSAARVDRIADGCNTPWKCYSDDSRQLVSKCSLSIYGITSECPVWHRDAANAQRKEEQGISGGYIQEGLYDNYDG